MFDDFLHQLVSGSLPSLEHANYSVDIHTTHFSFTRHDSIRVHTAVYASAAYAATEALRFGLVRPAFCPVPSVYFIRFANIGLVNGYR